MVTQRLTCLVPQGKKILADEKARLPQLPSSYQGLKIRKAFSHAESRRRVPTRNVLWGIKRVHYRYFWYDIFNCNWVATWWQLFSTHIHTNNTGNVTKQTIHRTTQKIHKATQQLGRVRAVPRLCGFYPGICPTTEEKARKNISQGSNT